jgi:hypothetical protein
MGLWIPSTKIAALKQTLAWRAGGRSNVGDLDYIVCLRLRWIMPLRVSIPNCGSCR